MSNKTKKPLVPRLRFPEFREAGEWEEERLGKALTFQAGFPFDSASFTEEHDGLRLIRNRDLKSDDKIIFYSRSFDEKFVVNDGDVLVGMDGDFTPCVWNKGKALLNQRVGRILPHSNSCQRFMFYFLTVHLKAIEEATARTTVKHLSHSDVEKIREPLPALPEQQKIADCLASLDELLTLEAQQLATLKTHKKGLMQQLFPAVGETLPKLRFPEFLDKGEWEKSPLSEYVSSLDAGVSVVSGDRPAGTNEVGILKTSAVTDGVFNPQENKVVLEKSQLQRVKEPVSGNSIIISRMNTPALVGANAYVANSLENIFLPDRLWAAKPRRNTSMRFIAFVLGSEKGRAALSELATGTSGSMKNITKPDVLALEITAPSFDEQQKIASCLASLDDLITAQTQKLAALKTHKKGLMQQLFPSIDELRA